jgi:hypothetical protein
LGSYVAVLSLGVLRSTHIDIARSCAPYPEAIYAGHCHDLFGAIDRLLRFELNRKEQFIDDPSYVVWIMETDAEWCAGRPPPLGV